MAADDAAPGAPYAGAAATALAERGPADPADSSDHSVAAPADPALADPVEALRSPHRIVELLNGDHDTSTVLQLVVDGVTAATGFQVAVINLVRGDGSLEVVAVAGEGGVREELLGARWSRAELDADYAVADAWGTLRFVPAGRSFSTTATWTPELDPLDHPDAWQADDLLFAPLCAPTGEVLGVLSVDLPLDGMRPGPTRRELLEVYATHAGIALNHAQQRERLRERIRLERAARQVVEATALLDVTRVVEASVGPVAEALGCEVAWLRTFGDEATAMPELIATGSRHPGGPRVDEAELDAGEELEALAERVARRCWAESTWALAGDERVSAVPGLSDEERHAVAGFTARFNADAIVLVPLGTPAACLGCLVLVRRRDAPAWTTPELEAALRLGNDLGRAVDNARVFEREARLRAELEDLDRYKSALIGTVCHELRTPLTSISGHVQLTDALLAQAPTSRDALTRNVERMVNLVDDLMVLAQVGDPRQELERRPVDLADALAEAVDPLLVTAEARRIAVRTHLAPVPGPDGALVEPGPAAYVVQGDATELERALGNLVGNAVKYSNDGGVVSLRLERRPAGEGAGDPGEAAGERVVFTCTDQGIGIDEEDQERLFTEFFRSGDPAARARPGSGLGLSIVARIAERHGGRVSVRSVHGLGSTFTLELPAAPAG